MTYFQKSGNKYHSSSTIYNGVSYHSRFEAAYAEALDIAKRAGEIQGWDRQVRLSLDVDGNHVTDYYIDFVIRHNDGTREFVECKGFETPEWRIKWKLFEALFELEFKHDPDDKMTLLKQSSWGPPKAQTKGRKTKTTE